MTCPPRSGIRRFPWRGGENVDQPAFRNARAGFTSINLRFEEMKMRLSTKASLTIGLAAALLASRAAQAGQFLGWCDSGLTNVRVFGVNEFICIDGIIDFNRLCPAG